MKGCRPLTDEEIQLTAASFGGKFAARDRALFLLGVKTGFRVSELLSLRGRDVVQADRVVDRLAVQRCNMKGKQSGRTVLLHPDAKAALTAWVAELQAAAALAQDCFIFQSRKGQNQPLSRVQAWRILEDAFASNDLTGNLGTHSMRKTFADRVHDRLGRDIFKTQKALGHGSIVSTIQYLSFREQELDEAILAT